VLTATPQLRKSEAIVDLVRSLAVRWVERVALCVLVLYFCVHSMPRAWRSLVTDFPNYYIAAQLAHEGVNSSRMYEWEWLEREKDHRAIPIRVIGLVPITPFSTLFVRPLARFKALTAKRAWIILSLALLLPIGWMLRSMTGLSYRRIALIFALNFPLYRNIEFGQFYVLLLLMIVAACWATLRGYYSLAGALVAIAAASKIFPLLFFVVFFRRRNWRALIAGALTGAASIALSIAVFGWNVHRTYLREILPAALHGEAMPPYVTNASISGILHVLFLAEPQWNPAPWHNSIASFAILLPLASMLTLAPAILLIRRGDNSPTRILLEWSALLTASLAVSTIPASYNFVLMALPMCNLTAVLLQRRGYAWLAALGLAYIGICFPMPAPAHANGLDIFLYTPRLPLMIAVLVGIYALLWKERPGETRKRDWTNYAWAAVMMIAVVANIHSTSVRETAMRREYPYRLPVEPQGYLNTHVQQAGDGVRYIAFTLNGYYLVTNDPPVVLSDPAEDSDEDDLSYTFNSSRLLVERGGAARSEIVDASDPEHTIIDNARDPIFSADGKSIAFIRDERGRGQLLLREDFDADAQANRALTPPSLNVYEASFLSASSYAFAATGRGGIPQIYLSDGAQSNVPLALGEARYPALSPDGAWLAFSRLENGVWNLWIRDEETGATSRIGNVPCNEIQPSWMSDSKTLLYSTDCGRSLWFTAIARRRVIP
jgi:hypothetical protein